MRYHDFLLQLHSAADRQVCVTVSSSLAGEGDGPFADVGLPREWSREAPSCVLRDLVSEPTRRHADLVPKEMGSRLYRSLFSPAVRSLFERSMEVARAQEAGLRLKILLNPRDPTVRLLQGLPWETLFREDTAEFLSLSRFTPVVRSLAVPQPPRSSTLSGRVRVLAAQALPQGAKPLDLARELAEMSGAESRSRAGLEVVPWRACLAELRETLDDRGPFDIFHFLGHADYLPDREEGVLLFEGEDGSEEAVLGSSLANALRDFPTVRLVVLNACKSARSALTPSCNPFGGVAAALVQAGFPAVLAMQEAVADEAAIKFSRALYRNIVKPRSLEEAVVEARQAVFNYNPEGFEWAVPSLFLRSSPSPDREQDLASLQPGDETLRLIETGVELFRSGDFALARQRLEQALSNDPGAEKARLFATLARMAMGSALPPRTIVEIDGALEALCNAADIEVVRLARFALAILRFDVVEPRRIRIDGVHSAALISDLAKGKRTPLEQNIARALVASRDIRVLLNLSN
jgi:hypothetical protein